MIHLDGQLETDDMAFAVTLICYGYSPEMERGDNGVLWTIPANDIDEDAEEFVRDWNRGRLRVEPRRFAREFSATRKDVYKMMGISDQPQGRRVDRRPSRRSDA